MIMNSNQTLCFLPLCLWLTAWRPTCQSSPRKIYSALVLCQCTAAFCIQTSENLRLGGGYLVIIWMVSLRHHNGFLHQSLKQFLLFTGDPLTCFEAQRFAFLRKGSSAQLSKKATLMLKENWVLPRSPPPFSSSSKERHKMITDSRVNEAWMIKEPRGERLSNTADTTPFFLFVSSSVHFQLGARRYTKRKKKKGREMLCHRVNLKETRQIGQKIDKRRDELHVCSRIQSLLMVQTYLKGPGKWPAFEKSKLYNHLILIWAIRRHH